ncbi:AEC family transporter [Sporosarcina sp. CAU 1771]
MTLTFILLIFQSIIIPILIMIGIGAILQRKFVFNLRAVSNLITYCLMPAAVFINLYETQIELIVLAEIIGYLLLFSLCLMIISSLLSKVFKLDNENSAIFKNSVVLINSGNYGIPVSQLLFQANPIGISIQIIVMVFQSIITYTYGLYNLISASKSGLEILRELLKLPIIYAMMLGGLLKALNINVPEFILIPISHLANAFLAIALILLGAQLAQIKINTMLNKMVILSSLGRLVVGPAVALLLIFIMGLDGVIGQSLLIASSFPASRNSSTLAFEYDIRPELAAQTVLVSTLLSSITVTLVIYLSFALFT